MFYKFVEFVDIGVGDFVRGEDGVIFVKVFVEDNSGKRGVFGDRRKVVGKVLVKEIRVMGVFGILFEGFRDWMGIVVVGN